MDHKDLLYLEDAHHQKLFYRFTPASIVSNFIPLIVILDDETNTQATHFEYKMWNVLTPVYTFGDENQALLQELIKQISQEYECEDHIYLYGNRLGGYGAILHAILSKANAVYAHTPCINLRDTNSKHSDLTHFLNPTDAFPIFYLCYDDNNPEDETAYFADACKKNGIKVHRDVCPDSGEDQAATLKKVLDMFERMTPED